MRIIDRFRGVSSRATPLLSDAQYSFLQSYGASDRELVLPTFNSYGSLAMGANSIVFGCERERINLLSQAPFKWRSKSTKKLFGDGALSVFEDPWPGAKTPDLWARMEQDATLAGNAFVRTTGDGLERLRPDRVMIVSEIVQDALGRKMRRVLGYGYDVGGYDVGRDYEFYDIDEVAHWAPMPDPLATFRGMSWLTPILREVDADSQMTDHKLQHLKNGATPNLLLKYQRRLDATKVDEIRKRFAGRYGGSDNSGRALIMDEGADATVIGSTLANLDFANVQGIGALRIGFAAGLPSELLPVIEGAKLPESVYAAAIQRFADMTMRPLWQSACGVLEKLAPAVPAGAELWFDPSGIAALQPGEQASAATSQAQVAAINTLIMAGFSADSAVAAVVAGDMSLLRHTGLVSVQMQSVDGTDAPSTEPPRDVPSSAPVTPAGIKQANGSPSAAPTGGNG